MEIVIASANVHKIREFRDMLKAFPNIDVLSLLNFPQYKPPEETGKTFQENALIKAQHAFQALKKWTLADDSGLVVPVLNGMPGIFSRRYAGDDATDAENRQKLLKALAGKTDLERNGYFECSLAFVGNNTTKCFTGICEGTILTEEKGRNGFGYDSVFKKYDYEKSFAELPETTKNRISHRAKALSKLVLFLESIES